MNRNYLLTLPAFNQSDSISGIIQEAKKYDVDILVIDDGSTDDTKQKIVKAKDVFKIFHAENLGYGRTLINSFQYAIDNAYDFIITMDTDGQHMPDEIPLFINEIPKWDMVSGSRYLDKTNKRNDVPPDRYRINKEITSTINRITGLNITDSFCGFKAYTVNSLKKLNLMADGYGMPLQVWIQAWQLGFKIKEIPVKLVYNDFTKRFSNGLHDPDIRLKYYNTIIGEEIRKTERKLTG
ncbi:MAG: glycosyltransferase family 2 protein [Candidatus Anammoxibacter sp.]